MARTERELEEKGPLRSRGLVVANIADRMINQVRAEVISLARSKMDRTVVAVELGIPLGREGAVKAVPTREAAHRGPMVVRTRRGGLGTEGWWHIRQYIWC